MDYADGTQALADLEGQEHTVRVTRTVTNTETGEVQLIISDETVTLGARDGRGGRFVSFTMTLDGETLTINDGFATRSDGAVISITERSDVARGFSPEFVAAFQLLDSEALGSGRENEITTGFLVTGFETSPDVVALESGSVIYTGEVYVSSNANSFTDATLGTISLTADFDGPTIGGSVDLTGFETDVGTGDVSLTLFL